MSTEGRLRDLVCRFGDLLYRRGYAHGSTGNISVRLDDGLLVTPTNSSMGLLEPERLSKLGPDGSHLSGDKPSKEGFLHLAMYEERPTARAIVHLHCTHCVALSCLRHERPENVLPPITAYQVMRVGTAPLVPYYRPGDLRLAQAVRAQARDHHALLLANHGPVVAGRSLEDAVYAAEEMEETARLFFLLEGRPARYLDAAEIAELQAAFPS